MGWWRRDPPPQPAPPAASPAAAAALLEDPLVYGEAGGVRVLHVRGRSMPELTQQLAMMLSEHMTDAEDVHVSYAAMQSGWQAPPAGGGWMQLFFEYSAIAVLRPRLRVEVPDVEPDVES